MKEETALFITASIIAIGALGIVAYKYKYLPHIYKRNMPTVSGDFASEPIVFVETTPTQTFTSEPNNYKPPMNQALPPPNVAPDQGQKFENPNFNRNYVYGGLATAGTIALGNLYIVAQRRRRYLGREYLL